MATAGRLRNTFRGIDRLGADRSPIHGRDHGRRNTHPRCHAALIRYIQNNLKCEDIKLVEAEVLPEESIKRDPTDPEGTGPATYENWVATYCGTSKPFLVVFWASKEGGTMFRILLRPAKKCT